MDPDDIHEALNEIQLHQSVLNEWENSFIADMIRKDENDSDFTEKQLDTIEKILTKIRRRR